MSEYTWFIYAIIAAIAWGLGYVLDEKVLHGGVSPATLILTHALIALPFYLIICWKYGLMGTDFQIILNDQKILIYTIVAAICIVGGNYFILLSLSEKNATLTSIVEITYPFFVALFAWLLFRDSQMNMSIFVGGLFIFAGVALILRNN